MRENSIAIEDHISANNVDENEMFLRSESIDSRTEFFDETLQQFSQNIFDESVHENDEQTEDLRKAIANI